MFRSTIPGLIAAGSMALFTLGAVAAPTQIAVTNSSFEDPKVTANGGFYQNGTPNGWTGTGFSAQYFERSDNGGFTGQPGITGANGQYVADDGAGTLTQDLGVGFQPNTKYVVDIAGGQRSGFTGAEMQFGLQSTAAPGIDLVGATIGFIKENLLTPPKFDYASNLTADGSGGVFSFTTGNTAPTGNLFLFIRTDGGPNGNARIHADSVSVTAEAVPEPGTLALIGLGALGLLARRRR